eukprot:CAMPEP_0115432392 /NCGR_PEP_ID=MMETSP0271-20121206/32075_1 /TAXON_ID=71861 /ORGANISM="Scrippsiella trochoidea, Strain CCMP3099" /LENGTH=80 /DNA_ID=CAMNT_0002857727 /DNA_START=56 /DNA_END=294 /DNA_ORIENTATION=+
MASRARSSNALLLLVAAAVLLRWSASSPGFVGGAAPVGLRGSAAAVTGNTVARPAASSVTMARVAEIIAEQLGVDKEKVT